MKVCFVHRDSSRGGKSIEEIFSQICSNLAVNYDITEYQYSYTKSIFKNVRNILNSKADIFHITGEVYFLAYFLFQRKIVLTLHDIGRFKELKGLRKWIFGWLLLKGPIILADRITVVSEYTKNDIVQNFGIEFGSKISVIPNPTPRIFKYSNYDINRHKPRILQVGTGVNKNLNSVIEAVSSIDCVLSIIGPISENIKFALAKNCVEFENYIDINYESVYKEYVKSDIVIFVSFHEGFGMPILEAQSTGRPIIASKVTSIPEIGGLGVHYIEDPTNINEIRMALFRVINDDLYRNDLIQSGLENIKRFDLEDVSNKFVSLYDDIS